MLLLPDLYILKAVNKTEFFSFKLARWFCSDGMLNTRNVASHLSVNYHNLQKKKNLNMETTESYIFCQWKVQSDMYTCVSPVLVSSRKQDKNCKCKKCRLLIPQISVLNILNLHSVILFEIYQLICISLHVSSAYLSTSVCSRHAKVLTDVPNNARTIYIS